MIDRTGIRYGRLVVVGICQPKSKAGFRWTCRCDCGNETVVEGCNLATGHTTSCGCVASEVSAAKFFKHGLSTTPQHKIWSAMIERCHDPNNKSFKYYGARGITVCDLWRASFEEWWNHMSEGYAKGLTIERIDNDRGYEPGNVRWATQKEQQNHRRNNRILEFNGESLTMAQWSDRTGISYSVIKRRLNLGWTVADTLTSPVR